MIPAQILTIPDITRCVAIFLDIPTTLDLAETCKTINHIITTDRRFVFIKCIYITYNYRNNISARDWISLIQTSRYNYYKIIPSEWILFDTDYPIDEGYKEYYRQIQNDPVITYPKYFNELYSDLYYDVKHEYEYENKINWYELGLDKLIEHYKHHKKYRFKEGYEPVYLPLKSLVKFENTEFAKKFKILITNNNYYCMPDMLKFKYNNIFGTANKTFGNYQCLVITINDTKFCYGLYKEHLSYKLQRFLKKSMQITNTEAKLFANFIINKAIIDIRRRNNDSDDEL